MNPLILFDYFYYRLVYFYENTFGLIISKEIEGILGLTVFQFFNVISIAVLVGLKTRLSYYILIGVLIFVFNIIRYNWVKKYNELAPKWDNEPSRARRIKKYIMIGYCIISIAFFIFSINKI